MLIFLAIINRILSPYWVTLRKSLAQKQIAALTITYIPILVGHPIGIVVLYFLDLIVFPKDWLFYVYWFAMIAIAAIVSILVINGLLKTKFVAVQIIGSLGFVTSSFFSFLLLGENISGIQILAIFVAVVGVVVFSWPKNKSGSILLDRGIILVVIAVILNGLGSVFYKMAARYSLNYFSFLTGRFTGDLIGWTIAWIFGIFFFSKNGANDLTRCIKNKNGLILILGMSAATLLDSWLIYKLPVSTLALLGTLTFPATFFISYFKYNELVSRQMWFGSLLIIGSVVLYLL